MNRFSTLFFGIFLTFASSWLGLVVAPYLQLGKLQPVRDEITGEVYPPQLTGSAIRGRKVYAANGCVYCHTQQVRGPTRLLKEGTLPPDIARGWGTRRTYPRDYLGEKPHFLGTMRTGPDLSNVGLRYKADWQHRHLYAPAAISKGSTMPPFRYLYKKQRIVGAPTPDALDFSQIPGVAPPEEGYEIVPTQEARDLVAYLLSLKRSAYELPEATDR